MIAAALSLSLSGTAHAQGADPGSLEDAIAEIEELLAEAHFRTAKSVAETTLSWCDEQPDLALPHARRARLRVQLATALVALGDDAGARESLRRARALDPSLTFDSQETSPKLLRVAREAGVPRP